MASEELRRILNGPVVAGVGATVDAGLASDKFHVLPWNPNVVITADISITDEGIDLEFGKGAKWFTGSVDDLLKYAVYNVNAILGMPVELSKVASASDEFKNNLMADITAIVFLQLAYGYYSGECREASAGEKATIVAQKISEEARKDVINVTRLNRAATFILARMHTKYQTNHAIGGSPMQASMASSVRAFYGLSPSSVRSPSAKAQVDCIANCLYWAVHPANETLLLPSVIANTQITSTIIHAHGPKPSYMAVEEYFHIRANTPPASTHHFYVAAAAMKQLEPLGILPYIPEPSRTSDIIAGLRMIEQFGAKLHPAARYWGLDRLSANQKLIETMCADLGYAVKKLMPASSLAASPILAKEDGLDSAWKGLIDALRAAMDERGKELLDAKVFEDIKKAIAPTAKGVEGMEDIKRYLSSGKTAPKAIEAAPEKKKAEGIAPVEEESGSEDSGDDDGDDKPEAGASAEVAPAETEKKKEGGKGKELAK